MGVAGRRLELVFWVFVVTSMVVWFPKKIRILMQWLAIYFEKTMF